MSLMPFFDPQKIEYERKLSYKLYNADICNINVDSLEDATDGKANQLDIGEYDDPWFCKIIDGVAYTFSMEK